MSNAVELRTADSIVTEGVSLNDFERAYLSSPPVHKRLRLEDDIITTFRAQSTFGGGYTMFRVYGTVTQEQVSAVAAWARSMNYTAEYQTTNGGKTFKYLTGAGWHVAV